MTEKKILSITKRGVRVRREKNRIAVQLGSYELYTIPISYISIIMVFGSVEFTNPALTFLMHHNIPVFFLTYSGRLKGSLFPMTILASNYNYRLKQYDAMLNRKIDIAKNIVKKKILSIHKYFPISNVGGLLSLLETQNSIEKIMGIEGVASNQMFAVFKSGLTTESFKFTHRIYHPPSDEINTVLSMAYTIIYFLAIPLIISVGLDPFISFLHKKRGKESALALDIMEPIRPQITKEMQKLINRNFFVKEDFEKDTIGYKFSREGLLNFLGYMNNKIEIYIEELKKEIDSFKEGL